MMYCIINDAAELLGLPLIPPYSQASGYQLLHGVNYASAAAGILDITGRNFVCYHTILFHLFIFLNIINKKILSILKF